MHARCSDNQRWIPTGTDHPGYQYLPAPAYASTAFLGSTNMQEASPQPNHTTDWESKSVMGNTSLVHHLEFLTWSTHASLYSYLGNNSLLAFVYLAFNQRILPQLTKGPSLEMMQCIASSPVPCIEQHGVNHILKHTSRDYVEIWPLCCWCW